MKGPVESAADFVSVLVACLCLGVPIPWTGGWAHARTTRVLVRPSEDLAAAVQKARDNTVILLAPGTHKLHGRAPHGQGVLIRKKRNLIIAGSGRDRTRIRLASTAKFGFYIDSNVRNLRIEKLHVEGTPPLKTNTHAIGNYTGTTNVRNVRITDLRVAHVAVGISVGTSASGVFDGVTIRRNVLADIVGTDPGWGYGIHCENATNVSISGNLIERASRHSIYLARARKGASITIRDNLILNHNLSGRQPRWYCAALVCSRASDVRIAHNVILNPRAIGLSVERDEYHDRPTVDIHLLGNQIVGAHYVGIWLTTGKTHTAVGNRIIRRPQDATPNKDWHRKVSAFDFPRGKPTASALKAPQDRWKDPDGIAELGGHVYILKDGTLDKVTPYSWTYSTCPTKWPGAAGVAALADAGRKGRGRLYIAGKTGLHEVDPRTWRSKRKAGGWGDTQFIAAAGGYVHVLRNGRLHRITPGTLASKEAPADWSGAGWMGRWGDYVYVYKHPDHHRVDPVTLDSVIISGPKRSRPSTQPR